MISEQSSRGVLGDRTAIKVLWRNEHAVLVEKPARTLSVPGRHADDGRPVFGLELQKQLNQQVYPVHRLDFEVSGVMVFALNPQSHKKLNQGFEKKTIRKIYLAQTESEKPLPAGPQIWKRKILRGKKRSYESPHGDWAETRALVVDSDLSLWQLEPVTGKPHQLRLEMHLQGFPILGDELYNSEKPWPYPGIALRAQRIDFPQDLQQDLGLPAFQEVPSWT